MNLKSILKNHIVLKDGLKRGVDNKSSKVFPSMESFTSIEDPAEEDYNK